MYVYVITGRHSSWPNAFAGTALLLPAMCSQNAGPKIGPLRLENALMRRRLELQTALQFIPDQLTHLFKTEF
jgi:hypothetical protein